MTDLATGLCAADSARLSELVAAAETTHAALCHADAGHTRSLANLHAFADDLAAGSPRSTRVADMARRTVASEAAVPLRQSDRAMQGRMFDAHVLVSEYPTTFGLFSDGRISRTHVHAITRAGLNLPPEARRTFDHKAAEICERLSTTRAAEALHTLAERIHPQSPTERHREARACRRVSIDLLGEGMSRLTADIPTILGEGVRVRLDMMAAAFTDERAAAKVRVREAETAGITPSAADTALAADDRTTDHVRADTFCDLLLTGDPEIDPTRDEDGHGQFGAIRAHVQVVIAATTLAGTDEQPADLVGVAPVDAPTARELAGDCPGLDRVLVHPVSGQVLATDRYTPTLDLRRRLRARDRHCRFPGCRVPTIRCEIDHTLDFALGGPTRLTNLAGLCQRHHTMKQFTPWRVRQLGDGILEWTSPTGRTYTDEPPPPLVFFAPAPGDPPPF